MRKDFLSEANRAFESQEYDKAFRLYQNFKRCQPELSGLIDVNLSLMARRVGRSELERYKRNSEEKIIVYTCNFGAYEEVKEPLNVEEGVDYILFTDDESLTSETWEVVVVKDNLSDRRRASRLPKILAHKYLPDHDVSVYIDSSLQLKAASVRGMISDCMQGSDIALYKHYMRSCVYDEIEFVMRSKDRVLADPVKAVKTLKKYKRVGYPRGAGLFENAFIFRKNNTKIRKLNEKWWEEYMYGSERDQFTFMYALWVEGVSPHAISIGSQFRKNPYVNFYAHKYKPTRRSEQPLACLRDTPRIVKVDFDRNKLKNGLGVTVITPTGDRFAAFNRCIQWVLTQTVTPDQWIVVDDGAVPLTEAVKLPEWVTYVRREREPQDPPHTLSKNLLAALDYIENDRIFIMEDDDWYSSRYIEFMLPFLDKADLVATNKITYYHLLGRVWKQGKPARHSALAQTVFTSNAIPQLRHVCAMDNWEIREKGLVDRYWWHSFDGEKHLIQDHPPLHAGFKGLFGRQGLAEGHNFSSWGYKNDSDGQFLKSIVGDDIDFYKFWGDGKRKPFVIYTSISGGYDSLKSPLKDSPLFDFYVFSDEKHSHEKWRYIPYDEEGRNANITAKKPKIMPHLYFPHYQYSIFVDANIFILDDLVGYLGKILEKGMPISQFLHPERSSLYDEAKVCIDKGKCNAEVITEQVERYYKEGFRDQVSLRECNFIVREHNDPRVIKANTIWWDEVNKGSERDQISYPYAVWKADLVPEPLAEKGVSVRKVKDLHYVRHGDATYDEYKKKIEKHQTIYS